MNFAELMNFASLLLAVFSLAILHLFWNGVFHPLRSYPGPWYCKLSRLWYCYQLARGNLYLQLRRLHDEYGDVVRIAPDELSYSAAEAWGQIYGRNVHSSEQSKPSTVGILFPKDRILYGSVLEGAETMIDAEGGDYTPQRRALAQAFTRKSLLTRESVITSYVNNAISALKIQLETNPVVDMSTIFGNALFDISCKLTVNRDLGAINSHGKVHPSVYVLDEAMKYIYIPVTAQRLPRIISYPLEIGQRFLAKGLLHLNAVGPLVQRRLEEEGNGTDFVSFMGKYQKDKDASKVQVLNNATIFIAAGTETTATLLCGVIYYILSSRLVLEKLYQDIRSSAASASDLDLELTNNMIYLKACMQEALRIYPPVCGTLTRIVPQNGAWICGRYVPEKTVVGVNQWATYHNSENFKNPDHFCPERWLQEQGEYIEDRRNALQPFSYGPRKCIANELSLMTSKLFLARLLWEFDMELNPTALDWANQKGYMAPYKTPLLVKLSTRK